MNKDWYEFKNLKLRSYDTQVWVPLRASFSKKQEGEYGQVGFVEETFHVGTLAVSIDHEAAARSVDSNLIRNSGSSAPYVDDDGNYVRSDQAKGFSKGIDGLRLVLEQSIAGNQHNEWHLNQEFVLGLNLVRNKDTWVRAEEGNIEIARLKRDSSGKPLVLEAKIEQLKDFLCACKMGVLIGIYSDRIAILKDDPNLPWDRPTAREENEAAGWRWLGNISAIHEGGQQFGSTMHVITAKRTDFDPEDEAPALDVGGEVETAEWTVPMGTGDKIYRVSGELWKTDWIAPAQTSPRVADDEAINVAHFIIDGAGTRVNVQNLPDGLLWLWFRPEIVNDALNLPGGTLSWYTRDTGTLGFTFGNVVHFGTNQVGFLTVLAVDIRRLPNWDQERWAAFNSSPNGLVSKELTASQVHVDPAETTAPESELLFAIENLGTVVQTRYGVKLYSQDINLDILSSIHRFAAINEAELLNLAKELNRIFSDRVDAAGLQRATLPTQPKTPYGAINAVRYMIATFRSDKDAEEMCRPLFGIFYLRNADAHLPSANLDRAYSSARINKAEPLPIQARDMLSAFVDTLKTVAAAIASSADNSTQSNR